MRQLFKYILVVSIASGGYYAARHFDAPPRQYAEQPMPGQSPLVDNIEPPESSSRLALTALIDTERTFSPVPLPEQRVGVTKQPTIEKAATHKQWQAPEHEPSVPDPQATRYTPPELADRFPPQPAAADRQPGSTPSKSPEPNPAGNRKKKSNPKGEMQQKRTQDAQKDVPQDQETNTEASQDVQGDNDVPLDSVEELADNQRPEERGDSAEPWETVGSKTPSTTTPDDEGSAFVAEQDSEPEAADEESQEPETTDAADPDSQLAGVWVAADQAAGSSSNGLRKHRVVDGDTLGGLAKRYLGRSDRFLEIFHANSDSLYDPRLLPIGLELVIPDE